MSSPHAPPIPDTIFLPAWAIAGRKVTRMKRLLHIGDTRLYRELERRGLAWKRHPQTTQRLESEGYCAVCGDPVWAGLPWGSNGDPRKHWTCAEWERGRVVLSEGELMNLEAVLDN